MKRIRTYAASHGLAIICGLGNVDIPDFPADQWVVATDDCIVVGCLHDMNGPTEFTLAPLDELAMERPALFSGNVRVSGGKLTIQDIYMSLILEYVTPDGDLFIRVWANGHVEPDQIVVGFEPRS